MIYVRDKIEEIVLSIQSTGSVSSFVDNTGSYTITTTDIGNLQVGFKVVLIYTDTSLNRDVTVSAIDSINNTFTFAGTNITEPNSWEMAIYFEFGHRTELNLKYINKGQSTNKRVEEYPLFWLYTDFEEIPGSETIEIETTLGGAFVNPSLKDYYEEDRIEEIFKPVLYPYLTLIENAFNASPYKRNFVIVWGEDDIKFSKYDRPFFGSADKQQNVLSQVTDAIEWEVELKWFKERISCIN